MKTVEVEVKNPIESNVDFMIEKLTAELEKYQRIKAILENGESHNPRRDARLGIKRGPYRRTVVPPLTELVEKHSSKDLSVKEIIVNLMRDGEKRTISEMVNELYPSKNGSAKLSLKNKFATSLINLKREGVLEREKTEDGFYTYWNTGQAPKTRKRHKRRRKGSKKPVTKIPAIKWKEVILKTLKDSDKPMSVKEIVEHSFKGKHNGTKRVLNSRASVMTSFYVKEGVLVKQKDADRVRFTLAKNE